MDMDDIIEIWGAEYEAAWTGRGPVPAIGFNDMGGRPRRLEIVQIAGRAPAPFHKGFDLGDTCRTSGADAAAIMLDVRTGRRISDDAHAKRDEAAAICTASRMAITRWHVCSATRDGDALRATIYLDIAALNDAGVMQSHDFLVGEGTGWRGIDRIRRLAGTQTARRAVAEAPLTIDPILHAALRRLPRGAVAALEEHLRRNPTVPHEEKGLAMQANWDRSSLARHGLRLPDGVETVIVKKGVVSGRVRLAPGTTWCGGTLVHAGGLPGSLAIGMPGRRLSDVVEHPDIDPGLIVRTAVIDGRSALRITTEPMLEEFDPEG